MWIELPQTRVENEAFQGNVFDAFVELQNRYNFYAFISCVKIKPLEKKACKLSNYAVCLSSVRASLVTKEGTDFSSSFATVFLGQWRWNFIATFNQKGHVTLLIFKVVEFSIKKNTNCECILYEFYLSSRFSQLIKFEKTPIPNLIPPPNRNFFLLKQTFPNMNITILNNLFGMKK